MIYTALSPNSQKDDFKLALKVLSSPDRYLEGKFCSKVNKWFREFFDVGHVITYESARTALYFVLKELGIGQGDEVIIQAFTCVAAANPIKWTGATPVFVDIDSSDFNLDFDDFVNSISDKTKAVVVQHTFGYPAVINKIVELAKSKGIHVIEDCAHTIGTELGGKKLGTFGDAAIFSLGRDKAISASFGGVVITNDDELGKSLKEGEKFLTFPAKKWIGRQVLYTIVAYLTREYYDTFFVGKLIHSLFLKTGIILKATTEGEKKEGILPYFAKSRLPNALARIAYNQLEKLDEINKKKRKITKLYNRRLAKLGLQEIKLPAWNIGRNFFPIRFPLLVKKRDELKDYALKRDIILGDWYEVPVAPKEVNLVSVGYKQGSCPKAEGACKNIVNLPLHINLSEEEAMEVVALIRDFYT